MAAQLAIRNGTVVTADATIRADIAIRDGVIEAIGDVGEADENISADGLLVLPGGVDPHTHLESQVNPPDSPRSPSDYYRGTVAAACGGITTIVDYARQYPDVGRLADVIDYWNGLAAPKAVIDYAFHIIPSAITSDLLRQLPAIVEAGFPTYKIFMMRMADREMLQLMRAIRDSGGMAMVHCENAAIDAEAFEELAAVGRSSARYWSQSRPAVSEYEATGRAVDYAGFVNCPLYIVHVSSAEAVARLRRAKAAGARVWVETRPCYLLFTEERYARPSPGYLGYTGYPPLRADDDVAAIWRGVEDTTIDVLGSDHAAWSLDQKLAAEDDLTRLPIGLPSLETQTRAIYTTGVAAGRISVNRFAALTATNAAIALGLYPKKGTIAVGSDADLLLWDPARRGVIRNEDMHGGVGYEPCDGMECTGWPVRTISRGETVVLDGQFVGRAGRGQLVRRPALHQPSLA